MLVLPVHQVSNLITTYTFVVLNNEITGQFYYQRLRFILLELFVLLMVMMISLDVLKSTGMEYGALFVMTSGT